MPELPEVTTTVAGIRETSMNKRIIDVWSDWNGLFPNTTIKTLRKKIVGEKIEHVERCGKQILLHVGEQTLLAHMRMTGHFLYGVYIKKGKKIVAEEDSPLKNDPYNRHVHFVIHFENGKSLALSDARKFAKIRLHKKSDLKTCDDITGLGPDALFVSIKDFTKRIGLRPNGKIKQVLMNQEILAGIGNIYSDEGLWSAGILPTRKIKDIREIEVKKLYLALKDVLKKGVRLNGDSDNDYRNIYGLRGNFQKHHRVYRKTGKLCDKKDGGTIKRMVVGGRSAHYCPVHQK